jgi:putative addiction module killer protein
MQEWTLNYHTDEASAHCIEKWFDQLTQEQLTAVSKELKLLELSGNELKLPHSRSLGKGLFELRERHHGYRIYYGFHQDKIIGLLVAGDKATQKNDIIVAREKLAAFAQTEEI